MLQNLKIGITNLVYLLTTWRFLLKVVFRFYDFEYVYLLIILGVYIKIMIMLSKMKISIPRLEL